MTIEEMKNRKRELGLSNSALAQLSGVPFGTIQKLFSGTTQAPRRKTIEALEKALSPGAHEHTVYSFPEASDSLRGVREPSFTYGSSSPKDTEASPLLPRDPSARARFLAKRQGEYTLEDYYALPDERRVELIDGEIFDMAAPSMEHQLILGELYLQFRACADAHGGGCRVLLAPCDVQLDNDDKTMVQPDLFVLCRKVELPGRCVPGAPDLTLEILSDSTRSKDMLLKAYKYKNAGIREYWIVDPKRREVFVYDFENNDDLLPARFSFSGTVPILISGGRCSVDFTKISRSLD